jgi:hypothetical protein
MKVDTNLHVNDFHLKRFLSEYFSDGGLLELTQLRFR